MKHGHNKFLLLMTIKEVIKNLWRWQLVGVQLLVVILLSLYTYFAALPSILGSIYALAGVRAIVSAQNSSFSPQIFTAQANTNFEQAYAYHWVPSSLSTYERLAQVFTTQDNLEGAITVLNQAYQLWPANPSLQQELAHTYLSANKMEEARKIWASFGTTTERKIVVGDEYLKQYYYQDALDWYNLAALDLLNLSPELAFRRAALAIMVHSSKAQEAVADLEKTNHERPVYQIEEKTTIPGAELRLLTTYPEIPIELYGKTLADGYAQTKQVPPKLSGILWRSGEAIAIIQVNSGHYMLSLKANHRGPAGVKMAIGVDNQVLKVINLDSDISTWETIKTTVTLQPGLHTVNLRFLNELSVNGGEDRKMEIAHVEIEKL